MKTGILTTVLFIMLIAAVIADPNTPPATQSIQIRELTAEEQLALTVNGETITGLVGKLIERELPRQVNRAKDKLAKELTIAEIQAAKK